MSTADSAAVPGFIENRLLRAEYFRKSVIADPPVRVRVLYHRITKDTLPPSRMLRNAPSELFTILPLTCGLLEALVGGAAALTTQSGC